MLLEVRHVTRYHYAAPVRESLMEVWMQPRKTPQQRLTSFDLELDPAAQVFSYADPYGNAVYHFDVPHPHDQLTITARSVIETANYAAGRRPQVHLSQYYQQYNELGVGVFTLSCLRLSFPSSVSTDTSQLRTRIFVDADVQSCHAPPPAVHCVADVAAKTHTLDCAPCALVYDCPTTRRRASVISARVGASVW
jgi:transglutaminase-like putative cysteine protease